MEKSLKRSRGPNYSEREKQVLISIVYKYKDVIENKKTDGVTILQKEKTWKKIETEFNARSPGLINRSADSLKKYYDNRKKELRKEKAQEKIEVYRTGGGPCAKPPKMESSDEVLLSMVNEKTVSGILNTFDGDSEVTNEDIDISIPSTFKNDEVELSFELDDEEDMQETPAADTTENSSRTKHTEWESYSPADLKKSPNRLLLNDNISKQSQAKRGRLNNSSRRRPATIVKTLTSSNIADKYDKLLDRRLALSLFEKIRCKNQIEYETEEHRLRTQNLKLEILMKKEQLKSKNINIDNIDINNII
ncbi:uncharacterized protein LOC126886483 [Diabrotica virgifera virgifera]|uniref:Regulatory protein zeste n=1 Tax=Diabrotica virgifera virgifera TaxID=50390 RepID=A0ABM5KGU0_DIAVI|nr:uncharacterized protein LOC126886483 [Diabrotica virgifera virgifera]